MMFAIWVVLGSLPMCLIVFGCNCGCSPVGIVGKLTRAILMSQTIPLLSHNCMKFDGTDGCVCLDTSALLPFNPSPAYAGAKIPENNMQAV